MNFRTILLFLLYFLFTASVKSQSETTNIKSYEDQVMIRINLDTNIEQYIFSDANFKEKIKLAINNKINTSFSLDYKILSVTLALAPRFIPGNNENSLKGKSSYADLRFRFFLKSIIQTVYYKRVKGFYLENMHDFVPGWNKGTDPYTQFPDLRIRSYGGSTAYVLNQNASLKSIYTQGEWQKNSSGSFMPFLDYDLTVFADISEENKNKETQFNIGANMGYFYNWVIGKNVNISPYLALGIGGKFSSFRDQLEDGSRGIRENNQYLALRFANGLHIGYNSDRFLFGGKINFNSYVYNEEKNYTVENSNIYGLIYVGYRFDPPKKVKTSYEKIRKKIPVL